MDLANNAEASNADKGELMSFMQDMKKESQTMMQDLMDIDDMLVSLEDRLRLEDVDKRVILKTIEEVRLRIGVLEKEDKRELSEEAVAESLLKKLKKWVDQVV